MPAMQTPKLGMRRRPLQLVLHNFVNFENGDTGVSIELTTKPCSTQPYAYQMSTSATKNFSKGVGNAVKSEVSAPSLPFSCHSLTASWPLEPSATATPRDAVTK